jgi:hypothetical protein
VGALHKYDVSVGASDPIHEKSQNLLASAWIDTAMGSIVSHVEEPTAPPVIGLRDFDFLVGEWRVHHHYLSVKAKQS